MPLIYALLAGVIFGAGLTLSADDVAELNGIGAAH